MAYRILVVDDDRSIVKMIKDFLEMEEYHVDTALNGEDALRKAETHPDLIILDINLPSINGIEVCKKIRDFVGFEAGDSIETSGGDTEVSNG